MCRAMVVNEGKPGNGEKPGERKDCVITKPFWGGLGIRSRQEQSRTITSRQFKNHLFGGTQYYVIPKLSQLLMLVANNWI